MNFGDYPLALREGIATFNQMRRMGIDSDDIYLVLDPQGGPDIHILVKQGTLSAKVRVGECTEPSETIQRLWMELAQWWNDGGCYEPAFEKFFQGSAARSQSGTIYIGLTRLGFKLAVDEPGALRVPERSRN